MERIFLFALFALMLNCMCSFSQTRTLKSEVNGFKWYIIKQNEKCGVEDISENTLIPLSRGYTLILFNRLPNKVGYFTVEKNGKYGACDIAGNEIIPCQYKGLFYDSDDDHFVLCTDRGYQDTSINLNPNGHAKGSTSNNGLRYKGLYTISSQGRSLTTGGYTGIAGPDMETEIEIYDDHIMVGTTECTFSKVSGGERAFSSRGWGINGWHTYSTYYVDSNYNIRRVDTSSSQFGTDWFEYEVAKGRCTMPKYQPKFSDNTPSYSGGGSSYQSGNRQTNKQNSTKQRKACRACMYTNGECVVCKGTGRQTSSVAGYSTKTQCRNCGGDGRCPTCGGDGWIN